MSEQPDIVERLRSPSCGPECERDNAIDWCDCDHRAMTEAADEIQRLRAEVARLTEGMNEEYRVREVYEPLNDFVTDSRFVSPWKEETR